MGFYNLISASKLSAIYDGIQNNLILYAEGEVQNYTTGIAFNRDQHFVGGLKFDLGGWTGPLASPPSSRHYSHSQRIDVPLPKTDTVIIADAENPNGVPVKVMVITAGEQMPRMLANAETTAVTTPGAPGEKYINSLFGVPFEIKADAQVPQGGGVTIQYDNKFLELLTSSIQGNQIVWKFNSKQTGNSKVTVNTSGGIATFVMTTVYDVNVFVLKQTNTADAMIPLSFLGMTNIGLNKIRQKYPNAKLYEVDGKASSPTTVATGIDNMRIVCQLPNNCTAMVSSTSWGEFGPVEFYKQPFLEDQVIPWPVQLDLDEAVNLLHKAGYSGTFNNVTLRKPLYPGVVEPSYIFGMTNGEMIFVGVDTKKVTNHSKGRTTSKSKKSTVSAN